MSGWRAGRGEAACHGGELAETLLNSSRVDSPESSSPMCFKKASHSPIDMAASSRSVDGMIARQQAALDKADIRERRLVERLDELASRMAEQADRHEEAQRKLMLRVASLEHGLHARESEARALRLAMRNVALAAGVAPPPATPSMAEQALTTPTAEPPAAARAERWRKSPKPHGGARRGSV